jgi:hypothetical protein
VQRLEPALRGARTQHVPRRDLLGETLERDGTEIAILEQAPGQRPCARCNYDRTWLSQSLEASGQIGRLADDRPRVPNLFKTLENSTAAAT